MGKGANAADSRVDGDTRLQWDEIKKHDKEGDRWVVIDNQVFNITNWAKKHPGGPEIISHFSGQDASEAFHAFHRNQTRAHKFMKVYKIGTCETVDEKRKAMSDDLQDLRETYKKMGLFKPSKTFFTFQLGQIVLLEILAFLNLWYFGTDKWWPWLLSVGMNIIAQAQAGWLQHDFGHWSVFKSRTLNHILHLFVMNHIKGGSAHWWNNKHSQHHAKTNVANKDPETRIRSNAVFVVGDLFSRKFALEKKKSLPYNYQHRYFFFIGPTLLGPVMYNVLIMKHVLTNRLWVDLAWMITFYMKFLGLYIPMLGVFGTMKYYFAIRCVASYWYVLVSWTNHLPLEIVEDQAESWLAMQLKGTLNVDKSAFNDWFTGHLNFQIEHHLFPTMPRHNLYKTTPLVKELCKKYDVPYRSEPLWGAFSLVVRTLKESGQLWHAYKKSFHHM